MGSARHKRCSWPIGARQEQWLRAHPQATAAQAATLAPSPPFNARVETVTTKPFFREPFTPNGGLGYSRGSWPTRRARTVVGNSSPAEATANQLGSSLPLACC